LNYIIVKASMIFGRGDHMLDHLSHSISTFPLIATVGFRPKNIRPLAIDDLVRFLEVALTDPAISNKTIALVGPEELQLSDAVRRVAHVLRKRVFLIPAPVWFHYVLAQVFEWTMKIPLVAKAQIRILSEGVVEPAEPCDAVPVAYAPQISFEASAIRNGLPAPGPFGLKDLRCCFAHER
jgi:NADH dehydrogenase